jgi:hypothetical protein
VATVLSTLGSNPVAVPVAVSNAAARLRLVVPLTFVNTPPAYSVVPDTVSAPTC